MRGLSEKSATATAVNGGIEVWSRIEHLLADIWVVLVQANTEKGSLPEDFDHPERAKMTAAAKATAKKSLKELFLQRKRRYSLKPRGGEPQ